MEIVRVAARIADDVLFPAALATDAADTVPIELLDALAEAGLYGLSGPAPPGEVEPDFQTVCAVVETLASGCLTTAFVWAQHLGAVRAAARSENESVRESVASLRTGERRGGLALGGAPAGPARLVAREAEGGWIFTGQSPFVSGWGRIDVMHTAARTADARLVWALVDAHESATLVVGRLDLVALNATATVQADFRDHFVASERVASIEPYGGGSSPPELLRFHASFALGVAARCCSLLGSTGLDEELSRLRADLDRLDPATIEALRGAAGELALRAAAALAIATGSRSLLVADHAQRLMREAMFALVYALRPGSREALLGRLGASAIRSSDGL